MSDSNEIPPSTVNALTIFEKAYKPTELFVEGAAVDVLAYVKAEVDKAAKIVGTDISTEESRSAIKALAFKVTKTKTGVDKARVEVVKDAKAALRVVDSEGKKIWDGLEAMADAVRKPVTDWENAETVRVDAHQKTIEGVRAQAEFVGTLSSADVQKRINEVIAFDPKGCEEFETVAAGTRAMTLEALQKRLAEAKKYEDDQAELERLRADSVKRQQEERDRQIAETAAQTARDQAAAELAAATKRAESAEAQLATVVTPVSSNPTKEISGVFPPSPPSADRARKAQVNTAAVAALREEAALKEGDAKAVVGAIVKGLIPNVTINY